MFQYWTATHREAVPKPLPKVAFRYQPGVTLSMGNHDCSLVCPVTHAGLSVREWQFRSEDHFITKVRRSMATLDPALPMTMATHYRTWGSMSDDSLRAEYTRLISKATVYDPLPLVTT
jgi:hypothetical protein